MAAGQLFKAVYEFSSKDEGVLSFKAGEQFTLVSKTNDDWWTVRTGSGERGLAPVTYLEACPVRNGPVKSAAYTTLYDYTAQESGQLSFSRAQTLTLVDKTDVSWWTMQTADGRQGIVPVNYIDKLDLPPEKEVNSPMAQNSGDNDVGEDYPLQAQGSFAFVNTSASNKKFLTPDTEAGFQQALASIDSNIARIHAEATKRGGMYTVGQKDTLRKLVLHRQGFVQANRPSAFGDATHLSPHTSPKTSPQNTRKAVVPHHSPVPKRHAPPPPTSPEKVRRRGSTDDLSNDKRRSNNRVQDNRYSLHESAFRDYEYDGKTLQSYNSLARRAAPPPPTRQAEERGVSVQEPSDKRFYSLQRPSKGRTSGSLSPKKSHQSASTLSSPPNSSSYSPNNRRASDQLTQQPDTTQSQHEHHHHIAWVTRSPEKKSFQESPPQNKTVSWSPGKAVYQPSSQDIPQGSAQQSSNSPDKTQASFLQDLPHQYALSVGTAVQERDRSKSLSSSPSSRGSSRERETPAHHQTLLSPPVVTPIKSVLSPPPAAAAALPTTFSANTAAELVETVRKVAGITHHKAQLAVGAVLQFLKRQVPQCDEMVDGLFTALEQAMQNNSTSSVSEQHSDLERLKEILFEITECKDDSQQRGWAVHDDEKAISDLLEEMLQILCDANPEVSKVALMEDKYENVLTLITYYQMEPRISIRLLLLKVFGVLCGLDKTIIGILLASVLPNELGRDIQQDMSELQKALYSSTVCTMIFSTAEALPLSVYDQWDVSYVMFLLDTIENPPPADDEEQLADAFLNMVLAFNQHFPDPTNNLVMKALKQRPNPRNFSEKLMFLINRGEDPVAIVEPCCPDSLTKFLLDLFSAKSTAGMFYTTDMRVLIDILVRQLTDLCPGMTARTHYLELLYRIVRSTDYQDHLHRQRDLVACLNRIMNEEESESQADRELVKKIWMAFPNVFEEITDL